MFLALSGSAIRLGRHLVAAAPYASQRLFAQRALLFHSTAVAPKGLKGKSHARPNNRSGNTKVGGKGGKTKRGGMSSSSRGHGPKGLQRTLFRSTSRTRLVKDLKPKDVRGHDSGRSAGKYEVADRVPQDSHKRAEIRRDSPTDVRQPPDGYPNSHRQSEGASSKPKDTSRRPAALGSRSGLQRHSSSRREDGSKSLLKPSEPHVRAADERISVDRLLDQEFDRSSLQPSSNLPTKFASPPLLSGLAESIHDILGADARPTPIQALALKHLFTSLSGGEREQVQKWKQCLLASETGSGKSIAYLLPLLQHLKETEAAAAATSTSPNSGLHRAINPRALVLAPTHELARQLSGFAKALVHRTKLRVLCASRANTPSSADNRTAVGGGSARQMKNVFQVSQGSSGELEIGPGKTGARPVDVLVGTPVKALEMVRGWGWDKVGKEKEGEFEREFRPGKPEMGLAKVEYVVVDEADVLFDPDFRETTLNLLSDISAARGHLLPPPHASASSPVKPISYPFNLVLTSATIPASLSSYLSAAHPSLTRLASPHLHRLPSTLHTEHVGWTGGRRSADVERRLRRVWAEDALRGPDKQGRIHKSKILVFCNRSTGVEMLGSYLEEKGIKNVALTSTSGLRAHGSNRHLGGFLKGSHYDGESISFPNRSGKTNEPDRKQSSTDGEVPHVLITTSLLSRGLDFSSDVQHVFIVDAPRNMVDFLHRAGRSGRAGQPGRVVVFGKLKGRGSGSDKDVRQRVRALAG